MEAYCSSTTTIAKPVADRRSYEFITVGAAEAGVTSVGARFLLVSDPEAVFAATCVNVQAGYFDDPPEVPGFAHWLEHAVHLGSGRYPDDKDYKYFLAQHGGSSNASTGMVHTSYHFTVAAAALPGALDRLARFFVDPLLQRDTVLREVDNIHAEYSRNCNSDARKLLQLRRSAAGGLLAKFSTGNAATLKPTPAEPPTPPAAPALPPSGPPTGTTADFQPPPATVAGGTGGDTTQPAPAPRIDPTSTASATEAAPPAASGPTSTDPAPTSSASATAAAASSSPPPAPPLDVPAALAAFWRARYLAGCLCGCVVGPQPLGQLRDWVREAFAEVRTEPGDGGGGEGVGSNAGGGGGGGEVAVTAEGSGGGGGGGGAAGHTGGAAEGSRCAAAAPAAAAAAAAPASGQRYSFDDMCCESPGAPGGGPGPGSGAEGSPDSGGAAREAGDAGMAGVSHSPTSTSTAIPAISGGGGRLGRLFRVAAQRQLRQLEVVWYLPYGMMHDMRSKPWRWAGHVLGHEGRGSLAALLRGAGLAQELTTGTFDEVRLGRGFMFWGVTLTLSEAGMRRVDEVLRLVFAAVGAMRALAGPQRRAVWDEVAAQAQLRWGYQDRSPPLELARDVAQRLHYFGPQEVLCGPSLMYEYDGPALDRFLSYLVPGQCNVYLSDASFAGSTRHVEKWYGARYSEEPLPLEELQHASDAAAAAAGEAVGGGGSAAAAAEVDPAGRPDDPYPQLLSRLVLPPPPCWALPVDTRLVTEVETKEGVETVAVVGAEAEPEAAGRAPEGAAAPAQLAAPGSIGSGGNREAAASTSVTETTSPPPSLPPPRLLVDTPSVRLWHRLDTSFGVPKTHVYAHLITPAVYASPASWVTARLACRLMEEMLAPELYDAQLLGAGYGLSAAESGLLLSLHGFSGVVAELAGRLAAAVGGVTLEQVEARYDLVAGKLLQSLRLWRHNNPAQHAEYGTEHLLQRPHWHAEQSTALLEGAAQRRARRPEKEPASDGSDAGAAAEAPEAAGAAASAGAETGAEAAAREEGEAVGPRAVWALLRGLGEGMALEVLVYGNTSEQGARELCGVLEQHLRPTGLGPRGWPATSVLKLTAEASQVVAAAPPPATQPAPAPEESTSQAEAGVEAEAEAAGGNDAQSRRTVSSDAGGGDGGGGMSSGSGGGPVLLRYLPPNPNPANSNSAIFFLCQVCEDDPADPTPCVLLDLLASLAAKPAFHELRTRQRLGYAVSLAAHRLGGVVGLALRLQSPDRAAGELRGRVAEWLAGFGEELRALSPERLSSFKASLAQRYTEPPRSLAEAARAAWRPLRHRSYDFGRRARKAEVLAGVGLQDLVAFYEQHVNPAAPSARVLCCEIPGGERRKVAAAAGAKARAAKAGEGAAAAPPAPAPPEAAPSTTSAAEAEAEAGQQPVPDAAAAAAAAAALQESAWLCVGSEHVASLHARLPHYCHSATLDVMRPLSGGSG